MTACQDTRVAPEVVTFTPRGIGDPLSPDVLGSRAELLRRSMMSGSDLSHVSKTARHGASAARRARIGVVNGWSGWAISGGVFLGKGVISDLSGTIPLV